MPSRENGKERFTLTLPPKQSKGLNDYCLAVANKQGKMPHAIKTKIMRMALTSGSRNTVATTTLGSNPAPFSRMGCKMQDANVSCVGFFDFKSV
jgi:hypothetical protein